jgi:hypothetical protein
MGDRGNIVIEQDNEPVLYFYTHWSGSDLPVIVANALDRGRNRWGDEPYLNRILFCSLVGEENWDDETGFGIDHAMGDGGTEVYIDHSALTVRYDDHTGSFEDFITTYKNGMPD